MDRQTPALLDEAERGAQRLAGWVRLTIGFAGALVFVVLQPAGGVLPPIPAIGFAGYFVLSIASLMLARPRLFRRWYASAFIALDMAYVWAVMALGALDIEFGRVALLPPFTLAFVLLALGAMRYSPTTMITGAAVWLAGGVVVWILNDVGRQPHLPQLAAGLGAVVDTAPANVLRGLFVVSMTAVLAIAVWRARRTLLRAIEQTQAAANLARYMPQPVADRMATAGAHAVGRGRRQSVAVMFADVRDFTGLTETMDPADVGVLLTDLRRVVSDVIAAHGGIVDKYIGDAVMAIFGAPEPAPDDAGRALTAAQAMAPALATWNEARAATGQAPARMGVGLHYGEVLAGVVGDTTRLEYTILGDTVNVAARVEALTKEVGSALLVTGPVLAAAAADTDAWQALPAQTLRGRSAEIALYRRRD